MNEQKTAILIDVINRTVRMVKGDYYELHKHMDCETWAIGSQLTSRLALFIDDNGLFKEGHLPAFQWYGVGTFVGNALILQNDNEGEQENVTRITVEEAKKMVTFGIMPNHIKESILDQPPVVMEFKSHDEFMNYLKNRA